MGNCQAAEAAMVVIQHPGGKLERVYWSVSAGEVMGLNPGHYVAVFITPPSTTTTTSSSSARPVKRHLKILRPDDTLHIGHVYRLVSFEEVLKEIAAKKHTRLSKMLLSHQQQEKDEKRKGKERRHGCGGSCGPSMTAAVVDRRSSETGRNVDQMEVAVEKEEDEVDEVEEEEEEEEELQPLCSNGDNVHSFGHGRRQWRPMLQTIAEVGN